MTSEPDADDGSAGSRAARSTDQTADDNRADIEQVRGGFGNIVSAWRRWRHSRPFWGGLFVILSGAVILLSERAPVPIIVHIGLQGVAGYLVPVILLLCGLLLWFNPAQRTFYSLLSLLLALGSWITSNLGGFFVGMLLGLLGGSLAFAWEQRESPPDIRRARPSPRKSPPKHAAGLSLIFGEPKTDPDLWPPLTPEPGGTKPGRRHGSEPDRSGQDGSQRTERGNTSAPAVSRRPDPGSVGYRQAAIAAFSVALAVLGSPLPPPGPPKIGSLRLPQRAVAAQPPPLAAAAVQSRLTALSALLTGLSFDGVAAVHTVRGTVSMLRFSMNALTLTGAALVAGGRAGPSFLISGSHASLGDVVLYTTKLTGDHGGTTVTFTPQRPPAVLPRNVTYTNLVIGQVYLTSDSLQATWSQNASPLRA